MSVSYAGFYLIFALCLSSLFKGSDAWRGIERDQELLVRQSVNVFSDLTRKAEAVWPYRTVYQKYISYSVGERVYVIRARFAEMLRIYYRNEFKQRKYDVADMVRNALLLQSRTQMLYDFRDDLVELDEEINTSTNYLNKSRFGYNNCHVAGPPCNIRPMQIGDYGRRSLPSNKLRPMDETLKLMDARRDFIKNKYKPGKFPRPIDIHAEMNKTFSVEFTTLSGSTKMNTDLVDLAPDFID